MNSNLIFLLTSLAKILTSFQKTFFHLRSFYISYYFVKCRFFVPLIFRQSGLNFFDPKVFQKASLIYILGKVQIFQGRSVGRFFEFQQFYNPSLFKGFKSVIIIFYSLFSLDNSLAKSFNFYLFLFPGGSNNEFE